MVSSSLALVTILATVHVIINKGNEKHTDTCTYIYHIDTYKLYIVSLSFVLVLEACNLP